MSQDLLDHESVAVDDGLGDESDDLILYEGAAREGETQLETTASSSGTGAAGASTGEAASSSAVAAASTEEAASSSAVDALLAMGAGHCEPGPSAPSEHSMLLEAALAAPTRVSERRQKALAEAQGHWVKCNSCHRWRRLPNRAGLGTSDANGGWTCDQYPVPARASCGIEVVLDDRGEEDTVWLAQEVLDKKVSSGVTVDGFRRGSVLYQVSWLGLDESFNSWELEAQIPVELVQKFEEDVAEAAHRRRLLKMLRRLLREPYGRWRTPRPGPASVEQGVWRCVGEHQIGGVCERLL